MPGDQRTGSGQSPIPPLATAHLILAAAAWAVALAVTWWTVAAVPGSEQEIGDAVDAAGVAGPVAFVLLTAVASFLPVVPNTPFFISGGAAWGPVLGSAYSMLGFMLGSAGAFLVVRLAAGRRASEMIARRAPPWLAVLTGDWRWRTVFWLRILPATNFDWLNVVAGLSSVPLLRYLTATLLGALPSTVVAVVAGYGLTEDARITAAFIGAWLLALALSSGWLRLTLRRGAPGVRGNVAR